MDTSWIQIFVLTLAECVAPAGKTICQEQQFELQFVSRGDCEYALQQLVAMKDRDEQVIVNRQKSGCVPSAAERESYASLDAIEAALRSTDGWRTPNENAARRAEVSKGHSERLGDLKTCDETKGKAPCKVGEIIVEDATGDSVDVWKRD